MLQKLQSSALRGAVRDDPLGYGTLYPGESPDLPDLSATPNRLLQSRLNEQAVLRPGSLAVSTGAAAPRQIAVTLLAAPAADVAINVSATPAWDGAPLADVTPAALVVPRGRWNDSGGAAVFTVAPRGVSEGAYFINFQFT